MKQIVKDYPPKVMGLSQLDITHLGVIVYKRKRVTNKSSEWALLARLYYRDHSAVNYGFVDMEGWEVVPCYNSMVGAKDAINKALAAGREVFHFDTMEEFVQWNSGEED